METLPAKAKHTATEMVGAVQKWRGCLLRQVGSALGAKFQVPLQSSSLGEAKAASKCNSASGLRHRPSRPARHNSLLREMMEGKKLCDTKAAPRSRLPGISLCSAEFPFAPSLSENHPEPIAPVCRYFSFPRRTGGSRQHFSQLLCSSKPFVCLFVCLQRSLQ